MNIQLSCFRDEIKQTFKLSVPFIAAQFVFAASGFIGTVMVARLGEAPLAASSLGLIFWITILSIFFSVLNAVSILVAHRYGAKNYKGIRDVMTHAYWMGLVLCILVILALIFLPYLLSFSSQSAEVLTLAKQYINALVWSIPGLILFVIMEQFLGGIGQARIVFHLSLWVVLMEIPCNYLFIFGKLGLPAFGVAGVGYALTVAYTISGVGVVIYLMRSKKYKQFELFPSFRHMQTPLFKELVKIGFPMGVMHGIELLAFSIATIAVGQFSTIWLAAHQISLQYLSFFISTFAFGMCQTVSIRVGHAVGEQNKPAIYQALFAGSFLGFLYMMFIVLALYFFPKLFIGIDVNVHDVKNASLVEHASSLLAITSFLLLFDNFRIIGLGALRGLKDTRFPIVISFFCFLVVSMTMGYFLGFKMGMEGNGIWWGLALGVVLGSVAIAFRLNYVLSRANLKTIAEIR